MLLALLAAALWVGMACDREPSAPSTVDNSANKR